ncbi:TPA: hypothetical protein QEM39_002230 [Pseudomonas putida]|uniref:hypothetical protein n=1 Tax=Pseudomonas putida TaxID=303 RepID=UPI0023642BC9|nr:hypothetical protein [Pseudomonas putida]MDD2151292.1 hypothetical protein [Pseudomonas putida]HDS1680698.1 hypothetical protein [Pseudomonas putida]
MTIQISMTVEHFVVATVVLPPRAANLRTASPEPVNPVNLYAPNETGYLFEPHR